MLGGDQQHMLMTDQVIPITSFLNDGQNGVGCRKLLLAKSPQNADTAGSISRGAGSCGRISSN
jgi:hypothetical protein